MSERLPNLTVYEDPASLAEAAARDFVARAEEAIHSRGRFVVALAGGSTPKAAYELLAARYRDSVNWPRVHAFFGDERTVPPDDEDSNFRMANEALLKHVPVGGVYRMRGELDPEEAARDYERELRDFFGEEADSPPVFDLVQLGMGGDGHTLSLFPRTPALYVRDRLAVENPVQKLDTTRLTLTLPVADAARAAVFYVAGRGKAEALKEVLEGDEDPHDYPSKLIKPEGGPLWMVDRAAGELLSGRTSESGGFDQGA